MNTKLIAAGAISGLVIAGTVSAQSIADATGLTQEQVIEIALIEVPGEVTEIELERDRGQQVYEVEILAEDGREMDVEVSAQTGEVLKIRAAGKDCDDKEDPDEA